MILQADSHDVSLVKSIIMIILFRIRSVYLNAFCFSEVSSIVYIVVSLCNANTHSVSYILKLQL